MRVKDFREAALDHLKANAESDLNKAIMSMKIILDHPAGIGDHSTGDLYNNLDEALRMLIDAEDRLEILEKYGNFQ
jgi:hypothetical protein